MSMPHSHAQMAVCLGYPAVWTETEQAWILVQPFGDGVHSDFQGNLVKLSHQDCFYIVTHNHSSGETTMQLDLLCLTFYLVLSHCCLEQAPIAGSLNKLDYAQRPL